MNAEKDYRKYKCATQQNLNSSTKADQQITYLTSVNHLQSYLCSLKKNQKLNSPPEAEWGHL
jgi:hypothetical protein